MRDPTVFLVALVAFAYWGLLYSAALTAEAEVTLPPVEVVKPACEWGGPYPYGDTTEMWIVICAKGEGDG